jgi:amino acid transporter
VVSILLAIPNLEEGAEQGANVVMQTIRAVLPTTWASILLGACVIAQYLCGLATLTSASRMAYAFARDGGLPASSWVKKVSATFQTPAVAIWLVSIVMVLFTVYTPVYSTITAVCTIFLYISYVLPTVFGLLTYQRQWKVMGPWQLGVWYRPLALLSIGGSIGLIVIGVQPPNEQTFIVVGGFVVLLLAGWFSFAKYRFPGPPNMTLK